MDKLGASTDSSLSAATLQMWEGFVCLMEVCWGFFGTFFYCSVLVFIFLLLTLHRKSQIHDNIMMPVQCGICVLFPVVEIPPVWRGTEQFFTHNINNRVNKRKYWIESIISSCPLTFRLVYPMLKWCRRAGTTLQVFRTLLVHIWDVLSQLSPGSNLAM